MPIIVTYNAANWYRKCIESLLAADVPAEDIIVVDNDSSDGTVSMIAADYPAVRLLEQKENLGFGKANNVGIREALKLGAQYVFLINQDATIDKDTLAKLVAVDVATQGRYGILSPVHYFSEHTLDRLFARFTSRPKHTTTVDTESGSYNVKVVAFVNAALWLISRDKILKVGGFNPAFNHYGEDDDYVKRMRYYGYRVAVVEGARGYHLRPQEPKPATYEEYAFKERKNNTIRWQNINKGLIYLFYQHLFFNAKKAITYLAKGEGKKAKFHFAEIFYFFTRTGEAIRLRKLARSGNAAFIH